jgi:trigger factor
VKVTLDKTENRQAYMTIEMEPAEVEEGLKKAYNRLVHKYNIPGFRKGKTPRSILEQYIGKEALLEDAVEHMAPDAFEKAAKEQDLKPIARPTIELEKAEPVVYKVVVPLEPTVKLGDYHQVKLTPESIELKEEDVEKTIEQLRHQHSIWEPVDRQVNSRDMVNLDVESDVDGTPYINQTDAQFEVEKDAEFPVKGFAEQLIGMKSGETKEFKLTFPEDYGREELAGKEVNFKVTVKEIKQEKLPEVNDDFAKQVNPEFQTVEDLRNKVRESLRHTAEDLAKKKFEEKVVNEVVNLAEVEYPPIMEEEEIDNLIRQQMRRWQLDAKGMDEYLKSIQKTPEELREELRPVAIRGLKQSLVLTEVARQEDIKIESDDIKNEVESMTKYIPEDQKEKMLEYLMMPQSQVSIASTIATQRTINRLTEIAQSAAETESSTESAEAKEEGKEETSKAETKAEEAEEPEAKQEEAK